MSAGETKAIRVLVVDDSAVMRGVMRTLFATHEQRHPGGAPGVELCGVVQDGVECLAAVLELRPDVVVLDLEMPRMHGLEVLEHLRLDEPGLPVIMCSAYTEFGARATLEALARGAADYVTKPSEQSGFASALEALASQLMPKIVALAGARRRGQAGEAAEIARHRAGDAVLSEGRGGRGDRSGATAPVCGWAPVEVVVIGVSTGGPAALEVLLPKLAADFPVPVMIVQHMPKLFTGALAERLDRCCELGVREAFDGAELLPGTIWLAPGDAHMEIREPHGWARATALRSGGRCPTIKLHQQPSLNHCKPSADYLFGSAAKVYGAGTLALVMTGMGADGLAGARRVHEACGTVLTQDEGTSAVWGMPGRVFEAGISCEPMPLFALAGELTRRAGARGRQRVADAPDATTMRVERAGNAPDTASRPEVIHGLL
jgi:two-component system, chemotaxis family, protein-glutamate methylesterase/glutaminase